MKRIRTFLARILAIRSSGQASQGPTMQQYYNSLDGAYRAGYEAGQRNKDIHEARAWIAKHVGE